MNVLVETGLFLTVSISSTNAYTQRDLMVYFTLRIKISVNYLYK
jgi:hypothetical protein